MALIEWSETLSVGITSIDEQHKQLVEIINELHEAMLARQGKEVLSSTFAKLIDYTENHFGYEAKLFREHGYEHSEAHLKQHDELTQKVINLKQEFDNGDAGISIELMDFLRDWLRNHIVASDKKYAPFLKEKGVT